MQSLRLLFSIFFSAIVVTSIVLLNTNAGETPQQQPDEPSFTSLFFFQSPASLFGPSATISLTDDNSTFFAARPAAFGPVLPLRGLSGQLWGGSGFGDNSVEGERFDGELGCSDARGDEPIGNEPIDSRQSTAAGAASERRISSRPISGTWSGSQRNRVQSNGDAVELVESIDLQPLRDVSQIPGKVVLLKRGGCGFSEKVQWAQNRGAIAVIVGDYAKGGPLVRMYARDDTTNITIPSLFTSYTTAHLLSSLTPDIFETQSQQSMASKLPLNTAERETVVTGTHSLDQDPGKHLFELNSYGRKSKRLSKPSRGSFRHQRANADDGVIRTKGRQKIPKVHHGLWVTLTPSDMNSSPFFHTLFVLVVSPLLTLIIVYSMLLLRSRIRRRRWRAPKSIVERLPVRTYHTFSACPSFAALDNAASDPSTSATPLLAGRRNEGASRGLPSCANCERSASTTSIIPGGIDSVPPESEKSESKLLEMGRRFKAKQMECVVCLEEYVDGVSQVMSLPCGHEFHVECITPWLTMRRRTCPICKGDVVRSVRRRETSCSARPNAENDELSEDGDIDDDHFDERNTTARPVGSSSEGRLRDGARSTRNSVANPRQDQGSEDEDGSRHWIRRHVDSRIDSIRRFFTFRVQNGYNDDNGTRRQSQQGSQNIPHEPT